MTAAPDRRAKLDEEIRYLHSNHKFVSMDKKLGRLDSLMGGMTPQERAYAERELDRRMESVPTYAREMPQWEAWHKMRDRELARANPEPSRGSLAVLPGGKDARPRLTPNPRPVTAIEHETYAPIRWIAEGVIADGFTIFGGKGKIGKSWLALDLALAVASDDGHVFDALPCEHGKVLYLALEDTDRRIQSRLRKQLNGKPFPERLVYATEWPNAADGGLQDLDDWLTDNPDCVLVIIDTLVKLKRDSNVDGYKTDYQAVDEINRVMRKHDAATVAIWHARKTKAGQADTEGEDPIDAMQGTAGIGTAADNLMYLKKPAGSLVATLYYRGREVEEGSRQLIFKRGCRWVEHVTDGTNGVKLTASQKRYVDAVAELQPGAQAQAVADRLNVKLTATYEMLNRLAANGILCRSAGGYDLADGVLDV